MWNDCSTGKKVIRIKIFHDSDPLLLKMLHAIVKCEINLKPSSYALPNHMPKRGFRKKFKDMKNRIFHWFHFEGVSLNYPQISYSLR